MTPTIGKMSFRPKIKENRWMMHLNIAIEGDIVQNETQLNLLNEDVLMKIQGEFEAALKKRVGQTVEKLQKDFKTDVIDFGRKFHQHYPKEWKKVQDHWEEKFPEVEVHITVNAKIRRPGYIGPPAALPRDEVKE